MRLTGPERLQSITECLMQSHWPLCGWRNGDVGTRHWFNIGPILEQLLWLRRLFIALLWHFPFSHQDQTKLRNELVFVNIFTIYFGFSRHKTETKWSLDCDCLGSDGITEEPELKMDTSRHLLALWWLKDPWPSLYYRKPQYFHQPRQKKQLTVSSFSVENYLKVLVFCLFLFSFPKIILNSI